MLLLDTNFQASLSNKIAKQYNSLISLIGKIPVSKRTQKNIDGAGESVSVNDILAYQIGWSNLLLSWYNAGIKNQTPQMPGEGFSTWDYTGLALHFYQKYGGLTSIQLLDEFHTTAQEILNMVEREYTTGNLDTLGIWPWCTLQSGKQWPLSKWIQVNTVAPYKRASELVRKYSKTL